MLLASVGKADLTDATARPAVVVLCDLATARVAAADGATASEIGRDLIGYFSHRLSPSEFREGMAEARRVLVASGVAASVRGRLTLTEAGRLRVATWLGARGLPGDWATIRDCHVMAVALGQPDMPLTRRQMLARPDGLRMAVLQQAYGLRLRRVPTPARVRAALAGVALKRAFGNAHATDFAVDGGVDANASRRLAGQLARRPQDFGTDSRLLTVLAAEAVDAVQSDVGTLRLTVMRRFVSEALGAGPGAPVTVPVAAADRPDIEVFSAAVLNVAERCAEGWPGNRKAFISAVWDSVRDGHPEWALSEIEFKSMLAEAHREGRIVLANADLKSKSNLSAMQRSAITYKNTVWHFIRVDT